MPPQLPDDHHDLRPVTRWQRFLDRWVFRRPLRVYQLYMIREDTDPTNRVGCDNEVVAVNRATTAIVSLELIYNDLLSLRMRDFGSGLTNALWGSRLTLDSTYVDANDIAHIHLSGKLEAREICAAPRIKAQLERPALQIHSGTGTVRATQIQVNGRPLDDVLAGR